VDDRQDQRQLRLIVRAPAARRLAVLVLGLGAVTALGCGSGASSQTVRSPTTRQLSTPATAPAPAPATTQPAPATSGTATPAVTVPRPAIVERPIPFGPRRLAEMAAYAMRHYGFDDYHLRNPHVIVEHFTATSDFQSAFNTFATDIPDVELHELPQVCAHFIVDRDGTIYQLVPVSIMCRHTVGLNWTAIGIEHVGLSDAEVLDDARQMASSLALTRWLRCRFHIQIANVIGHNESLSSPFHHENVAALRTQTHSDFVRADMEAYRARLRQAGSC
jgi:N-acetylmuramoyl-L-alanine amidase